MRPTTKISDYRYRETNVLPNGSYTTTMAFGDGTGAVATETIDKGHIARAVTKIEKASPTEYKFRSESSIDNGAKWVSSEGTSTKRAKSDTQGRQ